MSDVSVLSQEYQTASELSREVDAALYALKKAHLDHLGGDYNRRRETPIPDTVDSARAGATNLAAILGDLIKLLAPTEPSNDSKQVATARIPYSLASRLRKERRGELQYYLEDLREVADRLTAQQPTLSESDFTLLEHLASAADAQATMLYRRLMRI